MANKSETLSFRVPDNIYRQVYEIAANDRRKLSEVALGLLERGLAACLRDGLIFEPPLQDTNTATAPAQAPQGETQPGTRVAIMGTTANKATGDKGKKRA